LIEASLRVAKKKYPFSAAVINRAIRSGAWGGLALWLMICGLLLTGLAALLA